MVSDGIPFWSFLLTDPTLGSASNSNGDTHYLRGKTGSGSLLSSSELDSWNGLSNIPWGTANNGNSSALFRPQGQAFSPGHHHNGDHTTSAANLQSNDGDTPSLYAVDQHNPFDAPNYAPQEPPRHSASAFQQLNMKSSMLANFYAKSYKEESRRDINTAGLRANNLASSTQSSLRFPNADVEFSSLTPEKAQPNNVPTKFGNNFNLRETQSRSSRASHPSEPCYNFTSHPSHRSSGSTHRSFVGMQDRALQFGGQEDQLSIKFHEIDLQAETTPHDLTSRFQTQDQMQRTAYNLEKPFEAGYSRAKYHHGSEDMGSAGQFPASANGAAETFPTDYHRSMSFGDRETSSPATSDYRRGLNSPYSTNAGTPPTGPESVRSASGIDFFTQASNGQMATLDREPRGPRSLNSEEQYLLSNASQARLQYHQPYDFGSYAGSLRLNPLALPYPVPAYHGLASPYPTRYPSREHDSNQIVRSALLEDFRASQKTSKRYELKVSQVSVLDS